MAKNIILLFDIDKTLFDTDYFKKVITEKFITILKIKKEDFDEFHKNYVSSLKSSTDFNLLDFFAHAKNYFYVNEEELNSVYNDFQIYNQSLFDDVESSLNKLSRVFVLGIYSEGFKHYQIHKLNQANIFRYFDKSNLYIFRRKLETENLNKLPKNSIIIDDKHEVIKTISSLFPSMWLNRKSKDKSPYTSTIYSLDQIDKSLIDNLVGYFGK